jgi:hypothetical protein
LWVSAYLHGNPVGGSQLTFTVPSKHGRLDRYIFDYVAPLYRLALTSFLDLRCMVPIPPEADPEAHVAAQMEHWRINRFQEVFEKAIHTSRCPLDEQD